jgi:hypothetical protein
MSDPITKAALKLAKINPEFRQALRREIQASNMGPIEKGFLKGFENAQEGSDMMLKGLKSPNHKDDKDLEKKVKDLAKAVDLVARHLDKIYE